MKKNKQNCGNWWKKVIVLTFIVSLICLFLIIFKPYYEEVEDQKMLKAGKIFNEEKRVKILDSDCINGEIYFPNTKPDKMWIERINMDKPGKCYIRYVGRKLKWGLR